MADPGRSRPPVRVALLGSGGSIGTQAVDVLAALGPAWQVVALATGSQAALLEGQARRLRPRVVAIGSDAALDLPQGCGQARGPGALVALATREDVDLVVVGTGGVAPAPCLCGAARREVVATAEQGDPRRRRHP
jgi:1-deoxy-D-xylulose-5-phosphate reductoisomerase